MIKKITLELNGEQIELSFAQFLELKSQIDAIAGKVPEPVVVQTFPDTTAFPRDPQDSFWVYPFDQITTSGDRGNLGG